MPKLTQNSKYNITNHNAKIFFLAKPPGKCYMINFGTSLYIYFIQNYVV